MKGLLIQILPVLLIQGIYAIFIYLLQKRMKESHILPVVLAMIPYFGLFYFTYFFFYKVFKNIFNRLEQLEINK